MTLLQIPGPHGITLAASLSSPIVDRAVVLCHPHPAFGGRMTTPLILALERAVVSHEIPALRFNFRGLDGSTGTATGGVDEHEDVTAAVAWCRAQGARRIAVVGYSFGGLMACKAIARGLEVTCAVSIALPTTILGDAPDRLAEMDRALSSGIPVHFIAGDRDPLCDLPRLSAFCAAHSSASLEVLEGRGHFFTGDDEQAVSTRAVAYVVK